MDDDSEPSDIDTDDEAVVKVTSDGEIATAEPVVKIEATEVEEDMAVTSDTAKREPIEALPAVWTHIWRSQCTSQVGRHIWPPSDTNENLADLFTKILDKHTFVKLRDTIMHPHPAIPVVPLL